MDEFVGPLVRPLAALIHMLARALLWLGWDLFIETISWSIGWVICRVLTWGRFPKASIKDLETVSWGTAILVESVGLAALAATVWCLRDYALV